MLLHRAADAALAGLPKIVADAGRAVAETVEGYVELARTFEPQGCALAENHRGHLMFVKPEERPFVTAEMIRHETFTATEAELKGRIAELRDAGYTEIRRSRSSRARSTRSRIGAGSCGPSGRACRTVAPGRAAPHNRPTLSGRHSHADPPSAYGHRARRPLHPPAQAQQSLEWVAGSLGGGWYTMAAGLSSLIKDENPDIQIRVVPGGGLANATRVNRNTSPIGWGIDAFAASARRGEDPYKEAHTALRCLGSGYSPTEHHLLRRADAGPEDMKSILTMKGLKIACPQRSSTDEMTLQRILKFYGTSPERIRAEGGTYLNGSYADIGGAYTDGQVDFLYAALARPAAIFTEIAQGRRGGKLVPSPPTCGST